MGGRQPSCGGDSSAGGATKAEKPRRSRLKFFQNPLMPGFSVFFAYPRRIACNATAVINDGVQIAI